MIVKIYAELSNMTEKKLSIDEIFLIITIGLAQSLGIEPSEINLNQTLIEDLNMDPLDIVDLISFLENYLNREIDGDLFYSSITVEDIVNKTYDIIQNEI
jgi:acyl carrier protein